MLRRNAQQRTGSEVLPPPAGTSDIEAADKPKRLVRNIHFPMSSPRSDASKTNNTSNKRATSSRKTVQFRSSLFHKVKTNEDTRRALSKEDIRASPRLLGYLFQLLAATVMLISVLQFFFDGERSSKTISDLVLQQNNSNNNNEIWITPFGPVLIWKLFGCVSLNIGIVVEFCSEHCGVWSSPTWPSIDFFTKDNCQWTWNNCQCGNYCPSFRHNRVTRPLACRF